MSETYQTGLEIRREVVGAEYVDRALEEAQKDGFSGDFQRLECHEALGLALDELGEADQQTPAVRPRDPRPRPTVELASRGGDRGVDVLRPGGRGRCDPLLGRWVDEIERGAVACVDPLPIYE